MNTPKPTHISYLLGGDLAAPVPREWEPTPRWVRARYAGETIADSRRAMMLRRKGHLPEYWFPRADVRMDLLLPEAAKVKGMVAFLNERVSALYVDGEMLPKPDTPWA